MSQKLSSQNQPEIELPQKSSSAGEGGILQADELLLSYKQHSKEARITSNLISQNLQKALRSEDCSDFRDILIRLIKAARRTRDIPFGTISTVLFDIAMIEPQYRQRINDYLMRVALDTNEKLDEDYYEDMRLRHDFVRLLRGANIGEIAMLSLETRGVSGLGGLGLYIKDLASEYDTLGLDPTIITALFSKNRDWKDILEATIDLARLTYTGRAVNVPLFGDRDQTGYLYRTMLEGRVQTIAIAGDLMDRLYGGATADGILIRYMFFAVAALEAIIAHNVYPSVLQTNDQSGMAQAYLREGVYRQIANDPHFRNIVTRLHVFHNLDPAYHGKVTADSSLQKDWLMNRMGLDPWNIGHRQLLSPLEDGAINPAHIAAKATGDWATVSEPYKEHGARNSQAIGLGDLLQAKPGKGIPNGRDTVAWQKRLFDGRSFFGCKNRGEREDLYYMAYNTLKPEAKSEIQRALGLDQKEDAFVMLSLHRVSEQKGFDISIEAMKSFLIKHKNAQIIEGGIPEDTDKGRHFLSQIEGLAREFPGRFANCVGRVRNTDKLYQKLYLGSDAFLMPSKFEPHGLSQQAAMAAGLIVLARDIDGLSTSVTDPDEARKKGKAATGFKFFDFNSGEMERAMERMIDAYYNNNERWRQMAYNCFTYDSRWTSSAKRYVNEIFAPNAGVDMEYMADCIELLLIFSGAEKDLEYSLIKYGYNTDRGLDYVLEDALVELEKYLDDPRQLVSWLARRYYKKYAERISQRMLEHLPEASPLPSPMDRGSRIAEAGILAAA